MRMAVSFSEIDSVHNVRFEGNAKLFSTNVKEVVILNGGEKFEGNMSGSESIKAQSRNVVPSMSEQIILPENGYTHLSQVTMAPIPVTRTTNASGGITIKIG